MKSLKVLVAVVTSDRKLLLDTLLRKRKDDNIDKESMRGLREYTNDSVNEVVVRGESYATYSFYVKRIGMVNRLLSKLDKRSYKIIGVWKEDGVQLGQHLQPPLLDDEGTALRASEVIGVPIFPLDKSFMSVFNA